MTEVKEIKSGSIHCIEPHGIRKEERLVCPLCSGTRKKHNAKDLSWNNEKQTGFCHHCEGKFVKLLEKEILDYTPIEWKNETKLSDGWVKYFEGRRISQSTLQKMRLEEKKDYVRFPFFDGDSVMNVKSRSKDKRFLLESGKPLLFYNLNALREYDHVIVTEGEIDALSFIEHGFENVISVPNGANTGKMDYLDSCIDEFDRLEKVYLAVDNDTKGTELKNELLRRIGFEKCLVVDFGMCKDANEYLVEHGGVEFSKLLENAREPVIEGVSYAEDFYDEVKVLMEKGLSPGKTIGLQEVDSLITWETRRLAVVTGIPSHGKSEFVDFVTVKLNQLHGWKVAYFTPENYPLEYHYSKLYSKITGQRFNMEQFDAVLFSEAFENINQNYFWIQPKEDITIEAIIERARFLVKAKGIKVLVIDPFNKLEHNHKRESETNYISKFLDKLTNFAKLYDVLVILVAHPIKMSKQQDGTYPPPSLYDISGSSNFYNKCDYGLTIYRKYDFENQRLGSESEIYVMKVKFKHLGSTGVAELRYDYKTGNYE
ncbi:MAG: DnaB-like helicase C-terminal domain-containing protein [Bacteroidota bacterium]